MYIFELGRDREISIIEICSVLKRLEIKFEILGERKNLLFIKTEVKLNADLINQLGGVLRILELKQEIPDISDFDLNLADVFTSKSFNYSFYFFNTNKKDSKELIEGLKKFYKSNKLKGVLKNERYYSDNKIVENVDNKRKSHSKPIHVEHTFHTFFSSPSDFFSWGLDETFEIAIFYNGENYEVYKTIGCADPKMFKDLDENRPQRSFEHSSSFRLARMMVNILNVSTNSSVVDPFCGTGTFLIEGMIAGYNMIGLDSSGKMVAMAQKNAEWAKKKFNLKSNFWAKLARSGEYEYKANGSVFEPYLGPFLKKRPDASSVREILDELNLIYFETFQNLSMRLEKGSRVVCILPEFLANNNRPYPIDEDIFRKHGFSLVNLSEVTGGIQIKNPISYDTPDGSILKRKLYILKN